MKVKEEVYEVVMCGCVIESHSDVLPALEEMKRLMGRFPERRDIQVNHVVTKTYKMFDVDLINDLVELKTKKIDMSE